MARGDKVLVQAAHPQAQFTQDVILPGGGVRTEHVYAPTVLENPLDPEDQQGAKRLKGLFVALPDGTYAAAPKGVAAGTQVPVPMEVTDTPELRRALQQVHPTTGKASHVVTVRPGASALMTAQTGEAPPPPEPEDEGEGNAATAAAAGEKSPGAEDEE